MRTHQVLFSLLVLAALSCRNDTDQDVVEVKDSSFLDSLLLLQDELPANLGFLKTFSGKLFEDDVEMVLIKWGDGFLSGRYWSKKNREAIELSGEESDDEVFHIMEGAFGKETGIFSCIYLDSSSLKGTWNSTINSRQSSFELYETGSVTDTLGWAGNWYFNDIWDNGVVMIGNVNNKTFDFAIEINRGGHQGTIDGQANIRGSEATFKTNDFDVSTCILKFKFMGDHIVVEQSSSNFSCGFGARAFAGGRYDRIYKRKRALLSYGASPQDVFPSRELHDAFLSLVGQEVYDVFAFNMQFIETEKLDPKDSFSAIAVSGYVPGLFGSNEGIIMYGETGKIWASTMFYDKKNSETLLLYFTNDTAYKNRLPATIDNWREGFKFYRVIYPN